MAINKKLIHFKTFANFNSLKLSANEANTKYTTGISDTETSGNPDILYQSICFIKDTQQIWTHGLIYNASAAGGGDYITIIKFNELFAEGTITTNESDVFNVVKTAMESNTPLLLCDNNYSIILVSYYPLKVGSQIIASGTLSQNVYNFTFTSGSNQITVTELSVATLSNNLVSALGLESLLGKTYALPNTDAEAGADEVLLTYDAGVYKNKDYEGYDLGVVDGLYEERNGYPWALPSSDFSDVVGSEFTLASAGDVPAYYIADETANPLVLRSRDNDTNCYPGKLISIYFAEQFQEDQNQTISINGNEYDLLPTGLRANSGDTLLFVFSDDYIEPVLVSRAKELSTARSINGMNFSGSTNIYNFAICSTGASTANKIVSINNFTPNYGAQIRVLFTYSNTNAAPTLNVNNTGAKSMKYNGNTITNSNFTFDANKIYTFTCKDSSWDLEGDWDEASSAEPMICAYTIGSYTANHIELENHTYNGQTMYYREGAIISITNPFNKDIVFDGGTVTLDGNEYEASAFTIKSSATILFSLGPDSGIMLPISSVVESNSGGSSEGGSSAYAEINHGTSDRTFELTPNTFHVWDEMTAMTLTLGDEIPGVANEYIFQFTSPATPTSLTLPDDIKFSEDLVIEANMIYQISILKGLGSVLSWDSGIKLTNNYLRQNGTNLVFDYPVTSEVTVSLYGRPTSATGSSMPNNFTLVYPVGSQSMPVGLVLSVNNITPASDDTYNYISTILS